MAQPTTDLFVRVAQPPRTIHCSLLSKNNLHDTVAILLLNRDGVVPNFAMSTSWRRCGRCVFEFSTHSFVHFARSVMKMSFRQCLGMSRRLHLVEWPQQCGSLIDDCQTFDLCKWTAQHLSRLSVETFQSSAKNKTLCRDALRNNFGSCKQARAGRVRDRCIDTKISLLDEGTFSL